MADRTKLVLLLSLAFALLTLAGCGYTQQSRFQASFLPAAPRAAAAELGEPPPVEPNLYLRTAPPFVAQSPAPPSLPSRADGLVARAEEHLQRGRRLYQAQDAEPARKEFNAAIDLMLEASDQQIADRQVFERKFDEMVDAIHRYDLAGLGAGEGLEQARFEKAPLEDILEMTFPVDPKLKSKVREQIQATSSQLPLSVNDAVLGYINYFSGRGHKTLVAGLQRAGRYRPMIQRILDEEGVPQELIHLAQAESGFMPRAVSRMSASGMWQFMAFRGAQYGLARTAYADDRLDPEKATRAAARHLHDLFNEFGDWYLAIAAYNCGPVVVDKAVERTGYADFWELRSRRVLPAETTNYVPIILAMTIMAKNSAEYGLDNLNPEPPLAYDTVEIKSPTHLALVADLTEAPVSELAEMNPALLKGIAPPGYALHVPKSTGANLTASLALIPAERRVSWRMHKVENGETLAAIGKRYGTAPSSIAAVNSMESSEPAVGERLVIPAAYKEPPAARRSGARRVGSRAVAQRASAQRAAAQRTSAGHTAGSRRQPATRTAAPATARRKGPAVLTRTASNRQHASAGQ